MKSQKRKHIEPIKLASVDNLSNIRLDKLKQAAGMIIEQSGDEADREGLLDTPKRFAKAYDFLFRGYRVSPEEAVGTGLFAAEGSGLVAINDVEFYSMCEHHMLPFWGRVSVAYYPDQKIIGLSKIPRLIEIFARRMQVQERFTDQIAQAVQELVQPKAVIVRASAQHLCMMMRGVEKQSSHTISEAVRGADNISSRELDRMYEAVSKNRD